MARASRKVGPLNEPTAQASVGELAATPSRLSLELRFGLGTCTHLAPFHLRIRVFSAWPTAPKPTAQALPAEVAATPLRELSLPGLPRFGLGACRHLRPFQCRMR